MHRLQLQAAQQPLGLADAVVLDQKPPAAAVEQQLHGPDRFRLAALSLAALPVTTTAVAEQQPLPLADCCFYELKLGASSRRCRSSGGRSSAPTTLGRKWRGCGQQPAALRRAGAGAIDAHQTLLQGSADRRCTAIA